MLSIIVAVSVILNHFLFFCFVIAVVVATAVVIRAVLGIVFWYETQSAF